MFYRDKIKFDFTFKGSVLKLFLGKYICLSIPSLSTLIGTPILLLIYALIQSCGNRTIRKVKPCQLK